MHLSIITTDQLTTLFLFVAFCFSAMAIYVAIERVRKPKKENDDWYQEWLEENYPEKSNNP